MKNRDIGSHMRRGGQGASLTKRQAWQPTSGTFLRSASPLLGRSVRSQGCSDVTVRSVLTFGGLAYVSAELTAFARTDKAHGWFCLCCCRAADLAMDTVLVPLVSWAGAPSRDEGVSC
jgi:hypothetical protein